MVKINQWKSLATVLMTKALDSGDLGGLIDNILSNLQTIDTSRKSKLETLFTYILYDFFYTDLSGEDPSVDLTVVGAWDKMDIYYSSFRDNDIRFLLKMFDKLNQYTSLFAKIQTDNGFTKRIVAGREYSNTSTGNATTNNVYSETPSIEIQDFEDAIKYASNVSRNGTEDRTEQWGGSTDTITGLTYEQAVENLNKVMLNELADYIAGMPNMVYRDYALESMPVSEFIRNYREYIKTVVEITRNARR